MRHERDNEQQSAATRAAAARDAEARHDRNFGGMI
jgi:hypothetical protein